MKVEGGRRKENLSPPASTPAPWAAPPAVVARLERLGLRSPADLVLHLPLRYEDETRLYPIRDAPLGKPALVEGVITHTEIQHRGRRMLVCQVRDASGDLMMRFLNFYPSQVKSYAPGHHVRLYGEVRLGPFGPEMVHPRARVLRESTPLPEALTPIYPTTAGLSQETLRRLVLKALAEAPLEDSLPSELLRRFRLPAFRDSILYLHQPPPDARLELLENRTHPAWRRVKFDELLAQQLSMRLHYRRRRTRTAPPLPARQQLTSALLKHLPFRLTAAQRRVHTEIRDDLAQSHPMQRLLQGDVGSGKTIVAALAALQAVENGYQCAIMAPTEILAEQHLFKFSGWFGPLGVPIARLAGGQKKKEREEVLQRVASGEVMLVIGTHALFQEPVTFKNLGLAIVDEQHRFGVRQRLALRLKGGYPHQLMMSATPIPRTLSMSYYADLDVSVIDELPPGRTPVTTKLVSESRRDEVITRVRDACMSGRQAYWVCPLIEETPASLMKGKKTAEALSLKTVLETYEAVQRTFPDLRVGLIHGRLSAQDKAAAMERFGAGDIQLLVATTVIEVGVDVPNASLMVIEHAERMGLAQMHQLRGRVGRGAAASVCILLYSSPLSETARERLKIVFENSDGFEIARHDLRLRGPGELLGARQSGQPMLRFADIAADAELVEVTRDLAETLLQSHPEAARRHLARWLANWQEYLKA